MALPPHLNKVIAPSRPPNYKTQSTPVPGTKRPGQTAHYRNEQFGLIEPTTPNFLQTLVEIFDTGLAIARDEGFLGHRPLVSKNPLKFADHYVWDTYAQVDMKRRAVGSALHAWFKDGTLGGGELETVGIWSINRPEWQIVDLALHAYAKVGVSLYDTLGKESVEYIINHAHLTVIFATQAHVADLLKLAPKTPHVKMIVSIDELDGEMRHALTSWAGSYGIAVKDLKEVIEHGVSHPLPVILPSPETLANICYTSGTTGNPKGALLTHRSLCVAVQGQLCGFSLVEHGRPSILSYLPLAHIFERMNELAIMAAGGSIGFFTGDPLRLIEDAQILHPMYFPSVPRVLNRIYQAAMVAGSAPGLRGAIFRRAVATKLARVRTDGVCTHPVWDRIVFRKVQAVLGGNVKLISSGSAPIAGEVLDFLRIAFACDVWEGYGLTETSALATRVMRDDPTSGGCIGIPVPVTELKLVDVPSMNYTAEDIPNPRGEICARGPHNFVGYYKDEKATREALDAEGWVHTGDVGEIDAQGRFKIIDRVKNIMKLAQGEYVALEKIENLYMTCPLAAQLFVHGDPMQAYVVALVVPDPVQFAQLCSRVTGTPVKEDELAKLEVLCRDPKVAAAVLAELDAVGKKNLKGFEMVKKIHMTMVPFTVENGALTPTFKIKRKDAYLMHKKELDALYAEPAAKL
ncbi:acetyl-CoA synthetase-like protein [Vararia minispora EC-137]|uniref:Acetyl-CoA synthetase-like protein n=1 Tax=Vararia minispora EC-137 TaxID=1314806 RepID=A0ACB8QVM4_9AGAM|nr:acetyl-CoA synthetase-like protein [Vararia minispora EC-137]